MIKRLLVTIGLMLISQILPAQECGTPPFGVLDSVLRLGNDMIEGSGVVVRPNRVVTAAHVLEEVPDPVVSINGTEYPAEVLYTDPVHDVALLDVYTGNLRPIPIMQRDLEVDDEVWAVGFPLGGHQAANMGQYEGQMYNGDLQTTASVDHGQSGGALISCTDGGFVLAGVIKGFGAIDAGDRYIRLDDFSVAVPTPILRSVVYMAATQTAFYYREDY